MRKRVHVAVGVIHGEDGHILIARRAAKQHLGGLWEFPGGKVEAGESVSEALSRELNEELGIVVGRQSPLCKIRFDYPDKSVLLDVWHVHDFSGEPQGLEGQPLRWVRARELQASDFPEANRAIIRALSLPDFFAIVPVDLQKPEPDALVALGRIRSNSPADTLLRWRAGEQIPSAETMANIHDQNVRLIVDLCDAADQRWQQLAGISGVHANRHVLRELERRPVADDLLFGASCHNLEEVQKASMLGADYILLSPVQQSQSHPDQAGMGWEKFRELAAASDCAVYAMGGLQKADLDTARACGARGIAGIGLFGSHQLR